MNELKETWNKSGNINKIMLSSSAILALAIVVFFVLGICNVISILVSSKITLPLFAIVLFLNGVAAVKTNKNLGILLFVESVFVLFLSLLFIFII